MNDQLIECGVVYKHLKPDEQLTFGRRFTYKRWHITGFIDDGCIECGTVEGALKLINHWQTFGMWQYKLDI